MPTLNAQPMAYATNAQSNPHATLASAYAPKVNGRRPHRMGFVFLAVGVLSVAALGSVVRARRTASRSQEPPVVATTTTLSATPMHIEPTLSPRAINNNIEARAASSAWVSVGGVTVALGRGGVVNGIVFAVLAENRFQSLRLQCSGVGNPCRTDIVLQGQISEGRPFDAITTASIIGGAALTAVGMAMVIGGVLQNESMRAGQLQQRRLQNQRQFVRRARPTFAMSARGAGIGVGGSF